MRFEDLKKEIDEWLECYFKDKGSYNKLIYEAMNYSVSVGGKRIRPILLILGYSLYKKDYKEIIGPAAAIELIHTYSLIHDDLPCMDNDDMRRGKPTCHKVYDEAIAVLAGDGLLNEAANILLDYSLNHGTLAVKAAKLILEASGAEGMIGGQVVDILGEGKNLSMNELNYMHRKKTGALIKAAILAGAVLGGASEQHIKVLDKYGEALGLAFQIKDDILDIIGDSQVLGKNTNSDINNNKTTYVTMYGLEKCKDMSQKLTYECIELLKSLNVDTSDLQDLTNFLLGREY